MMIKRLLFFWVISTITAIIGYYILWIIMPDHVVFAAWYRMIVYHRQYPIQYILIPCFFYGFIATGLLETFANAKLMGKVSLTLIIIILTILISSTFGGILWHYHDMQAGFFPKECLKTMILKGFSDGLKTGWLIIILSFPYNILGSICCYFLTQKGSDIFFRDELKKNSL